MDSLLASYASSEDEEHTPEPSQQLEKHPIPKSTGFLSSLPPPKPQTPKNLNQQVPKSSSFSSLFSSLPPPKTHNDDPQILPDLSSVAPKRVVKFRPPQMNPPVGLSDDEDDEDEKEKQKQKKKSESLIQTSSVKSFLSSIPKPKNSMSLGAGPSASGMGRRSMLEADVAGTNDSNVANAATDEETDVIVGGYYKSTPADDQVSVSSSMAGASGSSDYEPGSNYSNYAGYDGHTGYDTYPSYDGSVDYSNYGSDNANYASYGQYENNWAGGSAAASAVPQVSGLAESVLRLPGKRGRNDTPPAEIVEVTQDELMKNRPREDQTKLTGIAFGPSYQPASTKGKPSKLHKRKHQIGSLYFDMKQKEMELAERRSQGFLTKAQTQGKYGW